MITAIPIEYVILAALATWHYALFCGFVSDDHAVIAKRKDIIPEGEKTPIKEQYWIKVFNDGILMYYLNAILRRICGTAPFAWHAFSLSLHLLNTYLFYKVATMMAGPGVGSFAALLWTVNPMLNQVVVWCSGRPYGIATAIALTIMLNWQHPVMVLPLYILGIITSVTIGFLPVLLKIMHPGTWQGNLYLCYLLLAIPFVMWKFARRFGKGALVIDRTHYQFTLRRINNIARVYVYYAASLLFPVSMGWYHQGGFRYNAKWDGFNIWAVIGYALIAFFVQRGANGAWFLLGMLPNMNLFATNSYLQDRYVYFGSMGFALIAAGVLHQYPIVFIMLVAIFMSKAYSYSRHMVDDENLYRENWRNHPLSDYAHNNLAYFLIQQNRYEEARAICQRGLDICRGNKLLWYNLGITWAATGNLTNDEGKMRFIRALDCWKQALALEPRWNKANEDIQKMIKFLVENKVLTPNPQMAAPNMPSVSVPGEVKT